MTVIFKLQTIEEAVKESELKEQTKGTARNVIGKQCRNCFMSFETLKLYPRQICSLCRWEIAKKEGCSWYKYIKTDKLTEEEYYRQRIARGIFLQRRKERIMRAKGVTLHRVLSYRIEPYKNFLDS